MKILILFIYSSTPIYDKMLNIQRKYIHNFKDFADCYFIQMRETQDEETVIEEDIVYVKGQETYLNILHKTIVALELLFKIKYEFFIRSNISTIIDIPKLLNYLDDVPTENIYTGIRFLTLNWIDKRGGIIDNSLFGTSFIGGRSIILSNDVLYSLLRNKDLLRNDIVDDVSIGLFITRYLPEAFENGRKYLTDGYTCNINKLNELIEVCKNNKIIFYRNKDDLDRNNDIIIMKLIYEIIYKTIDI